MSKIFKKTYNFFDKLIIVPISRLVYKIQKGTKGNGGTLDRLLNRQSFLVILSLILAVVLFLLIDSKAINLVENNAEVIPNVPVKLKYNSEAYVVEGVPETVNILLTGKKSAIYLAKQLGEFEVTLDLSNYKASDAPYKAYFSYTKSSVNNLNYKLDPSYVMVNIKNKVSNVATVSYELINQDKLDSKLSVKNVVLSKYEVVIKGSESTLSKVAWIKALVDLDNPDLDEAGSYDIDNVKLVAYDNSGNIVNNVEIVPNTLSATVVLDTYKTTIPVVVRTTGKLIDGKAIASIMINNSKEYSLTVYGSEKEISNIKSIPVSINIDGLGKENAQTYNVTLSKPAGIRSMTATSVKVALTFGNAEQKSITVNNISKRGLGEKYSANIISSSKITVICKGVSSVLNSINASDISAYVDLTGLGVGNHEVDVKIDNDNPLVEYIVSSKITVKITNN